MWFLMSKKLDDKAGMSNTVIGWVSIEYWFIIMLTTWQDNGHDRIIRATAVWLMIRSQTTLPLSWLRLLRWPSFSWIYYRLCIKTCNLGCIIYSNGLIINVFKFITTCVLVQLSFTLSQSIQVQDNKLIRS